VKFHGREREKSVNNARNRGESICALACALTRHRHSPGPRDLFLLRSSKLSLRLRLLKLYKVATPFPHTPPRMAFKARVFLFKAASRAVTVTSYLVLLGHSEVYLRMVEPFLSRVWNLHKALRLISVLCAVSAGTAPAWAGAILQLQIGSGGTVSYVRGIRHAGLQGNDIRIRQLNYGMAIIPTLMGHLFFHGQGFASSQEGRLLWGPGGSLVVRGCADLNADAKCDKGDIRGTLLTATFVNVQLIQKGSQATLIAQILDQINPQLAADWVCR